MYMYATNNSIPNYSLYLRNTEKVSQGNHLDNLLLETIIAYKKTNEDNTFRSSMRIKDKVQNINSEIGAWAAASHLFFLF